MTGETLETFINSLNAEADIDQTLLTTLVSTAKSVIEGERPWMVLRKTDSSKSVTTGNTWETAIDLSTITDFSHFYGTYPIRLFDGTNLIQYFSQVPFDRRLEYKNVSNTFCYDANSKTLYLNGTLPYAGSLYINYIATTAEIALTDTSTIWSVFPTRFAPLLGYYAVGIHKGAVDYDDINRSMLPTNFDTFIALKTAMEKWDNELQLSSIEAVDPSDGAPNPYSVYDS